MPRRVLTGIVVSDKADKTISGLVERTVMHNKYRKIIRRSKKYAVHDENNQFKIGDSVEIMESIPISKSKRWVVLKN